MKGIIHGIVLVVFSCMPGLASAANDNARFVNSCIKATNMERPVCSCVEGKAAKRLSEDGYNFLVASFEGDEDRAEALRNRMKLTEVSAASMLMVVAPRECVAQ